MAPWRTAGSVVAGTVATVVSGVLIVVLLSVVAVAWAAVVGSWLPVWVFAVPLVLCPIAGGFTTGILQEDAEAHSAILGGLAAALGVSIFGVVFGLLFLVLMLNMTPAYGQTGDLSTATLTMATLGGAIGFVGGAGFGAIGGVGGHVARRRRARG